MASLVEYLTKQNPLGLPSSSQGILRTSISPHSAKSLVTPSSVAEKGRPLTKTVFSSPPPPLPLPLPFAVGSPPSMRTFLAQRQSLQRFGVSAKPLLYLNSWSSAVSIQSSLQSQHLCVLSFHASSSAAAAFAGSAFAGSSFAFGFGAVSSSSAAAAAAAFFAFLAAF